MKESAITYESAVALIRESIERVAPDIDADSIPPDADMRVEAELDSMDFIAVLSAIKERTGIDVPEADMAQVTTISGCAHHLVTHTTTPLSEQST